MVTDTATIQSAHDLVMHYAAIRKRLRNVIPFRAKPKAVEKIEPPKPEPSPEPAIIPEMSPPVVRPGFVFQEYPHIDDILREVGKFYEISRMELLSRRRSADLTYPRHVAMYLSHELTPSTYPKIGRMMGGRDHTTILYGVRKIKCLISDDQRLQDELQILRMKIGDFMKKKNMSLTLEAAQ